MEGNDGDFYGVATRGGTGNNNGIFYKVSPTGTPTVLYSFGTRGERCSWPQCTLVLGPDGNFWGTTLVGGAHGAGTVFKVSPTGTETAMRSPGAFAGDGLRRPAA